MPQRPIRGLRSGHGLLALILVAASLLAYGSWSTSQEGTLASGPISADQRAHFLELGGRPDALLFFRSLSASGRIAMSRNIGAYGDPRLARLAAILLESFDPSARGALEETLTALARIDPYAVAQQMARPSSFQRVAIFRALRRSGPSAVPAVVSQLGSADGSSAAVEWLVQADPSVVPALLEALRSERPEQLIAAAEALGTMRATHAAVPLSRLYRSSTGTERTSYMQALAAIGAPSSESLLLSALDDSTSAPSTQNWVALGLGRIGSKRAIQALWTLAASRDPRNVRSASEGLALCGDRALSARTTISAASVGVAEMSTGRGPDEFLSTAIRSSDSTLRSRAIRAAAGRSRLVPSLGTLLDPTGAAQDGAVLQEVCDALSMSEPGRAELRRVADSASSRGHALLAIERQKGFRPLD